MTTLGDLVKDRKLYSIESTRSVLDAARFMMEHNIGALPVLRNGQSQPMRAWRSVCLLCESSAFAICPSSMETI